MVVRQVKKGKAVPVKATEAAKGVPTTGTGIKKEDEVEKRRKIKEALFSAL
jgi:hypothetical protein